MANFNLNKVLLAGNLVSDPQLSTVGDKQVCNFRLAVSETRKDGQHSSMFVDCAAWGKTADAIAAHCKSGKNVWIEGRLRFEEWMPTPSGKKLTKHSITVERCTFL